MKVYTDPTRSPFGFDEIDSVQLLGVANQVTGAVNPWVRFGQGLPDVSVHSLVLNQSTNELLAGTYGRSVYQLFLDNAQASHGALHAVSGSSIWTGPVSLAADTVIAASGLQVLKNGITTAQLNIVGTVQDADIVTFSTAAGMVNFSYNGARAPPTATFASNPAIVSFTAQVGSTTLAYNGAASPAPLDFDLSTLTPAMLQNYLSSIPGLAGNVTVANSVGGPFTVTFANGINAALLTVLSGPAQVTLPGALILTLTGAGPATLAFNGGNCAASLIRPSPLPRSRPISAPSRRQRRQCCHGVRQHRRALCRELRERPECHAAQRRLRPGPDFPGPRLQCDHHQRGDFPGIPELHTGLDRRPEPSPSPAIWAGPSLSASAPACNRPSWPWWPARPR